MIKMMVINGLVTGGMIAILAVGFSLIFGVAKIMNLAHTAFYMITAFIILICTDFLGLSIWLSAGISIVATCIIGMLCYKLIYDRVKEHEQAVMIISIAVAMFFQEILLIAFGARFRGLPRFINGFTDLLDVRMSNQHIFAFLLSIAALIAVGILLTKSNLGKAIRAVAQDMQIAGLMGIDVGRICMITMGISVGLAGIAGIAVGPIFMVRPLMWLDPLVIVLAAVVLGGLGSVKGSVLAAFLLGFTEAAVTFLIPKGAFLRGATSLTIMLIVLLIRPEGFFGVVFEEERL